MWTKWQSVIVLVLVACDVGVRADVSLPDVLSDGMVLQRDQAVPVWGTAAPGEAVSVEFGGQTQRATADAAGRWRVDLAPMKAKPLPSTLAVAGASNRVEVKDVLVGEVWVCSGQSNMVWTLANSQDGPATVAAARHPMIRLYAVPRRVEGAVQPQAAPGPARWAACTPESAHGFSAVGYYFGRRLHEELGVPVGLLFPAWGGTPAEAWTPRAALAAHEELKPIVDRTDAMLAKRSALKADYEKQVADWQAARKAARAAGEPLPRQPRLPATLALQRDAGVLYDAMVAPLVPFAIRGTIWYQGEANAPRAQQYLTLLPVMIKAWRDAWGQQPREFPFGVVQLPNFRAQSDQPNDSDWAHLRDAQRRVAADVPNVGLAVTIDVGETNDIHPRNKQPVGERLARWAMATVYGRPGEWSGPAFKSASFDAGRARVTFEHAGKGLTLREGADAPHEFTLAGADRVWHRAEAKITGADAVEVWSDKVPKPEAVRYAWDNNPKDPNLTNDTGVPAGPFRSDDWPGPTDGKR
jgi:sialate O-acetylesterase